MLRKIIHIDMDAFYASVEQRDNPKLRNKAIIVGNPKRIVLTCSYETRKYGVKSAMPSKLAKDLCPHAIFVEPNMEKYKEISTHIKEIFYRYSDVVEPVSLDEAYIDVTENKLNSKSAVKIALLIQKDIKDELGLTCSCGISYNKFLAKTASDMNKPNGSFLITPDDTENFLASLPITKFHGIGKKTAEKFIKFGVYTGKDLLFLSKEFLEKHFNTRGIFYYNIVRGIDHRPVKKHRIVKSISNETTFISNISTQQELEEHLKVLFNKAYSRLSARDMVSKTITIKIKYSDFKQITRSFSFEEYMLDKQKVYEEFLILLRSIELENGVRLLGVGFSNLLDQQKFDTDFKKNYQQLQFKL